MSNLPSKLYYVQLETGYYRAIFSNKKKMLETLLRSDQFRMQHINSYQSFSELIKWNSKFKTGTDKGYLIIQTFEPNKPLLE